MSPAAGPAPRIVVTLTAAARQADPAIAARKNALCVDSVVRHGATAIVLDTTSPPAERAAAFASMDGLMLTGGADLRPSRPGPADPGPAEIDGGRAEFDAARDELDAGRDELDAAAWAIAEARGIPVLGICRGLQAMNVFGGGTLLQHVDGHAGPGWGRGPALTHPLRLVPGTRMARILSPSGVGGTVLTVNSYHHQAVRAMDLSSRYVASGLSPSRAGDLVEAFESRNGPFRMAVQCHPERTESTPRAFERLFSFFVDACRGPLIDR